MYLRVVTLLMPNGTPIPEQLTTFRQPRSVIEHRLAQSAAPVAPPGLERTNVLAERLVRRVQSGSVSTSNSLPPSRISNRPSTTACAHRADFFSPPSG